jgi:hypothetical protein
MITTCLRYAQRGGEGGKGDPANFTKVWRDLEQKTETIPVFSSGLEKNPGFLKKNQSSWLFWVFLGFLGFFGFFARTRGFLGFFSVHEFLGASRL